MPDATECWLVEYADQDKHTVYKRFTNVNEAIPCLHMVLASGQRPRLYRETPITLTIDVGGEAPVKAPRRRRKKEAKEGAAPSVAPREGQDSNPPPVERRTAGTSNPASPVFDCEARFDGDPVCPGPVERDSVTYGWFCPLHIGIPVSGRREFHAIHRERNRPVRVAHAS